MCSRFPRALTSHVVYALIPGRAIVTPQAARRGLIPRVTRRLNDFERRTMIKSGAVFIFSVEESGIKRWTEGLAWSQSRISGNFLVRPLSPVRHLF